MASGWEINVSAEAMEFAKELHVTIDKLSILIEKLASTIQAADAVIEKAKLLAGEEDGR